MSGHANANWRNSGTAHNYVRGLDPGRGLADPVPHPLPGVSTFVLACGATTSTALTTDSFTSSYRTASPVSNRRYYAMLGSLQFDTAGPLEITCTATGFTPYMTLLRDANNRWTSDDGVLSIGVTAALTGPFVLEVTSVEERSIGEFDVHITCAIPEAATFGMIFTSETGITYGFGQSVEIVEDGPLHIAASVAGVGVAVATGALTLVVDGVNYSTQVVDAGGWIYVEIAALSVGSHTFRLTYPGDGAVLAGVSSITTWPVVRWPRRTVNFDAAFIAWMQATWTPAFDGAFAYQLEAYPSRPSYVGVGGYISFTTDRWIVLIYTGLTTATYTQNGAMPGVGAPPATDTVLGTYLLADGTGPASLIISL